MYLRNQRKIDMMNTAKKELGFTTEEILDLFRYCDNVAFFEAYFDESGTHDGAPFTCVGGLLAKQSSWISISNQWELVLKKFGVNACHATDLNNFRGEFKNWDKKQSNSFVSKLFKIIENESGLRTIGCSIERQLFDRFKAQYPDVPLTPYSLCVDWAMIYTAGGIAMRKKHMPPIDIVFERGQKNNTPAFKHNQYLTGNERFRKDFKIKSITWMDKADVIPFQLADMFVYELYKLSKARTLGRRVEPRFPLVQFQEHAESYGLYLSEKEMGEYYELYRRYMAGIPIRYR